MDLELGSRLILIGGLLLGFVLGAVVDWLGYRRGRRTASPMESVKVMHLAPGDKILLRYPGRLSDSDLDRIQKQVRDWMRKSCGIKGDVILFEEGLDLAVLRPEAQAHPPDRQEQDRP